MSASDTEPGPDPRAGPHADPRAGDGRPDPAEHAWPEAPARRGRWIGTVWALPLAALLIVAFLGLRTLSDRGIDVVVAFSTAGGARIDDTKVVYQGVEVGRVRKIALAEDGRRVEMTIRMDRRLGRDLTTTTTFWLVGVNPSLNDISSVKAALAGVTIGFSPGAGGEAKRRFDGLNEPPVILPGTPGTAYALTTDAIGNLSSGSPIFYHGQLVGRVVATTFVGQGRFRLGIFVLAPFDRMVRPQALFWISSPVQVSLAERGATASLEHASSLLNGALELDFVDAGDGIAPSPAGASFPLYQTRSDAEAGPPGPEVPYTLRFGGRAGDLGIDAPVRLAGFVVGRVRSVRMEVDAETATATTAVDAVLYPARLKLRPAPSAAGAVASASGAASGSATANAAADAEAWRRTTDRFVERLLARGHRATLTQSPPLIGARAIALDTVRAGAPAVRLGADRRIPSEDGGGDLEQITAQASQLMTTLNRVPIERIGEDVRRLTERLSALAGSPELASSLRHLNATLAEADRLMAGAAPKVGPLLEKLDAAAAELTATAGAARGLVAGVAGDGGGRGGDAGLPAAIQDLSEAARSIRTLADYLGRHPEALLRGRRDEPRDAAADAGKGTR